MAKPDPWARTLAAIELIQDQGTPAERKWYVGVEKYRIRKSHSLAIIHPDRPGLHETIAYFRDKQGAQRFAEFLELIQSHGIMKESDKQKILDRFRL
jgi:hypothetical protein